jgi:hypothetical protein
MKLACALLTTLALGLLTGRAQSIQKQAGEQTIDLKKVPKAVIIEFKREYPNAVITGCSKETENGWSRYEIESRDGTIKRDILYDPDGTALVIEESIPRSALPPPVRDAIRKEFPKGRITRQEKVIAEGSTEFEVIVKSGADTVEIVYAADGTRAKKEKK